MADVQRPCREQSEPVPVAVATRSVDELLLRLLAHPNVSSKESIIRRYDHEIRGATVKRPIVGVANDAPGDGVVLVEPGEREGIVVGIGVSPFTGEADAERMAWLAIDEAIRNVVCVGGDPSRVALLDNFSWGDPRRPSTLGQLVAAVDGCVAAADAYRSPFVSGKDSLNNEWVDKDSSRRAVPPTLVITAVAPIDNVECAIASDVTSVGSQLVLLGRSVSQWNGSHACRVTGAEGRVVPEPDLHAAARYARVHELIEAGVIRACHDCSEGGLAVALAEMLIGGRLGATCEPSPSGVDPHVWWFAEGPGRLLVEIAPDSMDLLKEGMPGAVTVVATTTNDGQLRIDDCTVSVDDLVVAFRGEVSRP
jgi:phosphoribosylformylglycinamidine synthase